MERTQIYLPGDHLAALRQEAAGLGISMTELVRRLVAGHVQGRAGVGAVSKQAVLSFVGLGASGLPDTSERHDRVLDEALRAQALR